jgi:hypothetical protein
MTVHVDHNPFLDGRSPARITIDWVSHTDGAVSLGICSTFSAANLSAAGGNVAAIQPVKMRGVLHKVETIPGLNGDKGTSLPTDQYDITLLDSYGLDIADGTLANRSGSLAEEVVYSQKMILDTELTLAVANAGSGLKGRIILDLLESEGRP